jgi:hypothetical protein
MRISLFRRLTAVAVTLAFAGVASIAAALDRTAAPAGVQLYFIGLKDYARVHSPLTVRFGLTGMGVAPAGVIFENTGHHHLLIDTAMPADLSVPLPAVDGKALHFGKGQTETVLTLAPGHHTLQLVLGDSRHVPFDPIIASPVLHIDVTP